MAAFFPTAALAMLAATSPHSDRPTRPLSLKIGREGDMAIVRVVGLAQAPTSVAYELEISSGSRGNRSVQRGLAQLLPTSETTVATVRVSDPEGVSVKLTVRPPGAPEYQEAFEREPR